MTDPELMELIDVLTRNLWRCCLTGSPAPVVLRMRDDMGYPKSGDLALEISNLAIPADARLGYLNVVNRQESEYDLVSLVTMEITRWTNAMFIKVPMEIAEYYTQ